MDKNILLQYCDLKKEIEKLEARINRLQKQSDFVSDVVQNGYKRHAVIYGYDLIRSSKLHKLERILQERYDKVLDLKNQIEEYISKIEKSDIRQIFEHRYIDNLEWFKIAEVMGYNNEDTPRKKHDRFLEKN